MSLEFAKLLLNKRSLGAALKHVTMEDLDQMLDKLQLVVQERREIEVQRAKEQEHRQEAIQSILASMAEHDVNIDDVINALNARKNKVQKSSGKQKRPPKYQYVDEAGLNKYWTGQGRTPKAMQSKIDSGKAKLADFLIAN